MSKSHKSDSQRSAIAPDYNSILVEVPLRCLLSASSSSRSVAERNYLLRKVFISHPYRISQIPT
eukprot:5821199-Pleurochrysis_carterae.AAC.8